MRAEVWLLLIVHMTSGLRRGPHHPHGQSPVERRHHHYRPRGFDSLTAESEVLHDIQHLEEDTRILTAETLAKMTPEELEIHYFLAHDFDNNKKLDGLEILKAVYHTVGHGGVEQDDESIEPEANAWDSYVDLVDRTLELDDTDNDGYVSYPEYRAARIKRPDTRTSRVVASDAT